MGVPGFLLRLFRDAPSKRRLIRSLKLDGTGGDRTLVSADGTRLSVRVSGDGPPLVLVHGTLDGISGFSLVEPELATAHEVWVYDRRGRGGSGDRDDYALDREVEDLRAVVEAAGGRPHVLGYSFGGVIAMRAAIAGVPMRTLTLFEPPMNGEAIDDGTITAIRAAVAADRPDDGIRAMAELAGIRAEEIAIALKIPPVRARLRDGTPTAPRELEALQSCDWPSLPIRDVPCLVLQGEIRGSEAFPTPEQILSIADDTEVVTMTGQDHLAVVFDRNTFADAVLDFLARH